MRLATIKYRGRELAGIVTKGGILPIAALNAAKGTAWKEEMYELIRAQQVPGLTKWYNEGGKDELETIPGLVPQDQVEYAPLYRNPRRIFGTPSTRGTSATPLPRASRAASLKWRTPSSARGTRSSCPP